ncbi:MAG: type II toxin-antitoxin system VapC family toxin [Acidobacteriia bacterium]|nr:type II toxin-antitoxin system VapC family toxin [Terriglobia bacterium]
MSRIFWDTNLFIYLFEGYGELSNRTTELRARMLARGDQLLTSTLTLGELLVKPIEQGDTELCKKYEAAVSATSVLLTFDANAAKIYARLRCDRSLRAPDAIQLACAAATGVDLFITNDARLQGKQVTGIHFIVPLDRVPV